MPAVANTSQPEPADKADRKKPKWSGATLHKRRRKAMLKNASQRVTINRSRMKQFTRYFSFKSHNLSAQILTPSNPKTTDYQTSPRKGRRQKQGHLHTGLWKGHAVRRKGDGSHGANYGKTHLQGYGQTSCQRRTRREEDCQDERPPATLGTINQLGLKLLKYASSLAPCCGGGVKTWM